MWWVIHIGHGIGVNIGVGGVGVGVGVGDGGWVEVHHSSGCCCVGS